MTHDESEMYRIEDTCTLIDARTLRWERPINAPRDRIWRALTEEAALATWFMEARVDLRIGGEMYFHPEAPFGGVIKTLEPGVCLEIDQEDGFIRFEITEDTVAFVDRMKAGVEPPGDGDAPGNRQPGGPGTHWPAVAAGWHNFLDALAAYVCEEPLPSMATYEALIPAYVAWIDEHLTRA